MATRTRTRTKKGFGPSPILTRRKIADKWFRFAGSFNTKTRAEQIAKNRRDTKLVRVMKAPSTSRLKGKWLVFESEATRRRR